MVSLFPTSQLLILKVCAAIVVVGLLLLGIDRFIVQPTEPSEEDLLAAAAEELGMTLHREYRGADELLGLTAQFEGLIEPAESIGAALVRDSDEHEIVVYEHRYVSRAIRSRAVRTLTRSHGMEVELLGILIRLPGADLPRFGLAADGRVATEDAATVREVLTTEAVDRMASFRDFSLAAEGDHVLFLSRPPASALVAASQRDAGPEFLPGLRSSGLKIDVQRAINVTNRLALDLPKIASVYSIDPSEIEVEVDLPELDLGLEETVEDTHREIEEIMEKHRRESEERQAEFRARMKEIREEMSENLSGHRSSEPDAEQAEDVTKGSEGESVEEYPPDDDS